MMDLKNTVRKAAVDNNIGGVMALAEACGLSYERTVRVWNGSEESKLKDIKTIFSTLNIELLVSKVA